MDCVIGARNMRAIVPRRLLVYGALFYVVSAWALNQIISKEIMVIVSPLAFMALRFLLMTPLAWLLARLAGVHIHIERRDLPRILLCSACGYFIYQFLWMFGLHYTTPFASALLMATGPIFTMVFVTIAGHEAVRPARWMGAVIALLGVAIFEGFFSGHLGIRLGDALALGSAIVFAGYSVLGSRLLARYSAFELLVITITIGALMLVPVGLPALLKTPLLHLGWNFWWRFGYAVLVPILFTYPVWIWGLGIVGAGKGSIMQFIMPVVAGVASVLLIHASFASYELLGAAICIGGMMFAFTLGHAPVRSPSAEPT
jgi:drug/metabolite transporter (DMT)-like permease